MTRTKLFRHILCPVDFSSHSRQALRYAAILSCRSNARLSVMFVEDPLLAAAAEGTGASEATRAELRSLVKRAVEPYGLSTRSISVHLAVGRPSLEIRRAVKRLGCDLVVMGAHGLTGVSKMMLGSTTAGVLRAVSVPVLATPPVKGRSPKGPSPRWPETWALAPIELGRRAASDIGAAAALAEGLGTFLMLVHVVPTRNGVGLDTARKSLLRLTARSKSHVVIASRVLGGSPAEEIVDLAATDKVELVVLTRRRGRGVFGKRLGSISYDVLCQSHTPVMALPGNRRWRPGKAR